MRIDSPTSSQRSRRRPLPLLATGIAAICLAGSATGAGAAFAAAPPNLGNAPVPAGLCGHPAGHLVDGKRHFGTHGDDYLLKSYSGAMQGGAMAVAVVGCNAGGVSWPATLVFYREQAGSAPVIVGSYNLSKIRESEHVDVHSAQIRDGKLTAVLDSYEGAGCEVHKITASFHVNSGAVVASNIRRGPTLNHCPA